MMTPREEFLKELGDLVTYTPERCKGAYSESLHEIFFNEFFHRWAPKDTLENPQKHDTFKECDGSDSDCQDKDSIHYWMCHMTQEEFEERTQDRQKTPFKLNKIQKT